MPVKKFPKRDLLDLLDDELDGVLTLVRDRAVDKRRWAITHELIFRENATEELYMTHYDVGATEQQETYPFEYEGDEIECHRVEAYEKTVIDYRIIK